MLDLSLYLKAHRSEYYDRLTAIRVDGNWEGWLKFFLRGVADVSGEATETARRILAMREEHQGRITQHLGRVAGNGHKVLQTLYRRPIVSVNDVQGVIGTTYPAANTLVKRLVEIGILTEITGNVRNRRFSYAPYLRLFTEGTEP